TLGRGAHVTAALLRGAVRRLGELDLSRDRIRRLQRDVRHRRGGLDAPDGGLGRLRGCARHQRDDLGGLRGRGRIHRTDLGRVGGGFLVLRRGFHIGAVTIDGGTRFCVRGRNGPCGGA